MSRKLNKKSRKKYERKTPTLVQQLEASENARLEAAGSFNKSFMEIQDRVTQLQQQVNHSHQLIDSQYAEISGLKEANLNLFEVINILGRRERIERQEKIFSSYNETYNTLQATASKKEDCCGKGPFSD